MLCLMLERMELSRGFLNLEKKTMRPHTSKITLLPKKLVINQLNAAKNSISEKEVISSVLQKEKNNQDLLQLTLSGKKTRPLSAAGALTPKSGKGMSRRTPSAFAMRYDKENKPMGKE